MIGGAKLLVDLVGFVYPAYMSFKSMDTNSGDDTQWLTYWICFSAMSITETMLSVVTALIPMYFWIKIAIIVVRAFFFENLLPVVYRMKICWIVMVVESYG
jgi:receptor expression-enhancing protein 5/6